VGVVVVESSFACTTQDVTSGVKMYHPDLPLTFKVADVTVTRGEFFKGDIEQSVPTLSLVGSSMKTIFAKPSILR
jgi:hypothetical protein